MAAAGVYIVVRRCQFSDRDGFLSRWEPSIAPASIARARGRNEFRPPPLRRAPPPFLPPSRSFSVSISGPRRATPYTRRSPDVTELATNVSLSPATAPSVIRACDERWSFRDTIRAHLPSFCILQLARTCARKCESKFKKSLFSLE